MIESLLGPATHSGLVSSLEFSYQLEDDHPAAKHETAICDSGNRNRNTANQQFWEI